MEEFKEKLSTIESENRLLMKCVAGSRMYNLNTESSDIDIRGVYLPNLNELILSNYDDEISSESQDEKFYSLPKFINLAEVCNPNIIELLYVPDNKIIFKSKLWDEIVKIRGMFISKRAKETFSGYAYSQIKKCQGNNKKANSISKKVNDEGIKYAKSLLNAPFSGKTRIPDKELNRQKLQRIFGGNFINYIEKCQIDFKSYDEMSYDERAEGQNALNEMLPPDIRSFMFWYRHDENGMPFRPVATNEDFSKYDAAKVERAFNLYRIYCNGSGFIDGNKVILSSISKEREMSDFIGVMSIDYDSYLRAKKDYDSFWEWMANRNEKRYIECWDSEKTCDTKNLMHCMRLLLCAEDIAKHGVPKVEFFGKDRDFLIGIRNGKENIKSILEMSKKKLEALEDLFKRSKIPENANVSLIETFIYDNIYSKIFKL